MSEEIKKQIRERLKGFIPSVALPDLDSVIFDSVTTLKIEELSKEFDMKLVIEVMQNNYYFATMTIDNVQAKREVECYRDKYPIDNISSREEAVSLWTEIRKLFDELVDSSPSSYYLIKDPDEWIFRIDAMKEKYGYRPFTQMYEAVHGIRKIMWSEGLLEEQASEEYAKRCKEKYHQDMMRYLERINGEQFSTNSISRIANKLSWSNSITANYQGSGGHGFDISTNGGGRKKMVTGKAGNRYPIPKRKGVR